MGCWLVETTSSKQECILMDLSFEVVHDNQCVVPLHDH